MVSTGPCDIRSKWGGIFFYGIHQVDMILRLLGCDVAHACLNKGAGENHTATFSYRDGAVATMNLVGEGRAAFHLSAIGEKGRLDSEIAMDESPYLTGVRDFVRMFKTGRSEETEETIRAELGDRPAHAHAFGSDCMAWQAGSSRPFTASGFPSQQQILQDVDESHEK